MRRYAELTYAARLHPFDTTLETWKGAASSKNEPAFHAFRDQFAAVQADLESDVHDIAPARLRSLAYLKVLYFEAFWHLAVGARTSLDRHLNGIVAATAYVKHP